ncbi:oxygenase MpaB family protein [Corynebacterium imitans]|uniref:oxygenase MpaB family protein n=1 Tax=Corynebacterium imitans TaxID=156978 RepID=UPI00254E0128|nr:oxygenase MpaB family protein [Corynebacterium imitans]MDK8307159.1 oxygenase MpaB family protein [Corynebacterium imitans]MDK8638415.1 oxygenase MpaB family protein [Corynebacterium imitans]MDK8773357.1 oxygenase MpaB family protein [Corynebacterium imitans]
MTQTFTDNPLAANHYDRSDWPAARGDREAFVAKFGEARAKRFEQALWAMDPIADALYTSGHKSKEIMPNLREALARGEADENTLPEVKALIDDMNAALDGVDWERLERGQRAALSIPVLAQNLSLGPGALVHTYATPSIANILVNTGELTEGAVHRLAYTTNWIYSVYLKDGLKPGNVSYIHTGMVRAMHAHVRRVQTQLGLDTSDWGAPISEFDMFRTWFDFTYIAFTYLRNLGYRLTLEEEQDLFYLWRVVGVMLGIPRDILEPETDIDASQESIDAIHFIDGEPNEASHALVEALFSGFRTNVKQLLPFSDESIDDWMYAATRIMHGDEVADVYNVPHAASRPFVELDLPLVQQRFDLLRANPEALEQEVKQNHQTLLDALTEETSYMGQDEGIKMSDGAYRPGA